MSSYNISNTKLSNNLTSTFTNAGNVKRSFTRNRSSGQNNNADIGSKVIDNNNVDKIKSSNALAVNNQRPILYKLNYGNLSSNNNAKLIRSTLTSTAIRNGQYNSYSGEFSSTPSNTIDYLCPSNDSSSTYYLGGTFQISQTNLTNSNGCYPFGPPSPELYEIPLIEGGSGLIQNGVYLRYRAADDLYSDWNMIYVPPSLLVAQTGISEDGTPFIYNTINFNSILPNGNYLVEYDLLESIS